MNFKRFIKKIDYKLFIYSVIFFIVLTMGFLFVYQNRLTLVNNKIIYNKYTRVFLPAYHFINQLIYKLPNVVYLPLMRSHVGIPEYKIIIDQKNLEFLNDNLPKPIFVDGVPTGYEELADKYKQSVPAKFVYEGEEYNVRVGYRGDHENHWAYDEKSWEVEFDKDKLFNGIKVLKLIIPSGRDYFSEYLNSYRAKKFGLKITEASFAKLSVNDIRYGVYYQFEDWSKEFLEKNELPSDANLYVTDDAVINLDDLNSAYNDSVFWKKKAEDATFNFDNYSEINFLIKAMDQPNFSEIVPDIIDLDSLYSWHTLSMLAGSQHQTGRGNSRLYFNNTSGKFEFIPWDIKINNLTGSQIIDNLLLTKIFSDPTRQLELNQFLWQYVNNPDNLADDLAAYDEKYNQLKPAFYLDWRKFHNNFRFDSEVRIIRKLYEDNFNHLANLFNQDASKVEVFFNPNKLLLTIDIMVDNFSGLKMAGIILPPKTQGQIELFYDSDQNGVLSTADNALAGKFATAGNTQELSDFSQSIYSQRQYDPDGKISRLVPTRHSFFIKFNRQQAADFDLNKLKVQLNNAITGKSLNY